jgi:hypothetical protein
MLLNFVASLPFPKALPEPNYYLPWIFFFVFYVGFVMSAAGLKDRAVRLKAAAKEAEQTLRAAATITGHCQSDIYQLRVLGGR